MIKFFALPIAMVTTVLILAGCPTQSTGPEYFVSCKIDGIELSLVAGPGGTPYAQPGPGSVTLDGIPSGYVVSSRISSTFVLASTDAIDETDSSVNFDSQPGAFICAIVGVSGVGNFTISSGTGGFVQFNTPDGLTTYDTGTTTINGSITKFEDVGGAIEGTFSGTVTDQSRVTHAIAEGSFRIKHYDPFYYSAP